MRRLLLVFTCLLACACFHDNASPFVHGAKNAPSDGGATHVAVGNDATSTTGTSAYGGSSGEAGGMDKQYAAGSAQPAGNSTAGAAPNAYTQTKQTAPAVTTGAATGTVKR